MWKKDEMPDPATAPRPETAQVRPERVPSPRTASGERATIGRSITIHGEVSGDEDLLIQGRVDGSVNLKQHSVTVGPEGEVKADITGRVVTVEGTVEGNVRAEEQVILRSSALVEGDIAAPRVVLEDGARFRGGVDMGESLDRTGRAAGAGATRQSSAPETGRTAAANVEVSSAKETSSSTDAAKSASTGMKDSASRPAAQVSR
jgi:cytoskeletal protein CcmA (bactofilin family)